MAVEIACPYYPPSIFEQAIFSTSSQYQDTLPIVQDLFIPGSNYARCKFSPYKPLRRLPQQYRDVALQPYILRAPDGHIDRVVPHRAGVVGKAEILEQWLAGKNNNPNLQTAGIGNAGELLAERIFQILANVSENFENIFLRPAPHQLDENNPRDNDRGGDLLLLKDHADSTATAICLIDVKVSRPVRRNEKGRTQGASRRLRSGVNKRLQYPIPVIVVFLGGIEITLSNGKKQTFQEYIQGSVFTHAKENNVLDFLPDVDPSSYAAILYQVKEQVHRACLATKRKIQQTAPDRMTLDKMLYQLALTDKILGRRIAS